MTASIYLTAFAEWFALGLVLVLIRQALMWIALRGLRPTILHRMELPEGHRIREPMRFGIVYTLTKWGGGLGVPYLIALVLHPVILGFDRGWTAQLSIVLMIVAGIAAALFALDRKIASWVRRTVDLPADWRARVL